MATQTRRPLDGVAATVLFYAFFAVAIVVALGSGVIHREVSSLQEATKARPY